MHEFIMCIIMNAKWSFLAVLAMAVLVCVGAFVPPGYPRGYYRQRQMEMEDLAQQLQSALQDNKNKEEQVKISVVANSKYEEEVDNLLGQVRTALAKEEQWEEEGMDEGEEPEVGGGGIGRGMDYEVQASWNRRRNRRFSCGPVVLTARISGTPFTFRCCFDRVQRRFCLDHRVRNFTAPCTTMRTTDMCHNIMSPRPSFLQNLQICFPEEGAPCTLNVGIRPCNERQREEEEEAAEMRALLSGMAAKQDYAG